jgi:hypothetical protein
MLQATLRFRTTITTTIVVTILQIALFAIPLCVLAGWIIGQVGAPEQEAITRAGPYIWDVDESNIHCYATSIGHRCQARAANQPALTCISNCMSPTAYP